MPFKGNRIFLVVGAIALIVIIVAAASANSVPSVPKTTPQPTTTMPPDDGKIHITINSNIGIQQVKVTNLNTARSISKTLIDLPFEFTCDRGDFLRFTVTTQPGYQWNAWWFNTMTFDNSNPMTMVAKYDLYMSPEVIISDELGGNQTGVT